MLTLRAASHDGPLPPPPPSVGAGGGPPLASQQARLPECAVLHRVAHAAGLQFGECSGICWVARRLAAIRPLSLVRAGVRCLRGLLFLVVRILECQAALSGLTSLFLS